MPAPDPPARGSRHVVVIGGGLSGLAASYDLARGGCRVTLLEAAPDFGGLASSFRIEGHPVERFYHFICRPDSHLQELVRELGLNDQIFWHHTRTAFYHEGRTYSFGTPLDLVRFTPVPWLQRFRFGLNILHSRYREQWKWLDKIPAKAWLIENIGEEAYNVIWHPLLRIKFGEYHDRISAAWVWHRIWRVARSRRSLFERERFGVLAHGTATLVDALVNWLRSQPGCSLRTGVRVEPLQVVDGRVTEVRVGGERLACDAVISTVALPVLDRLVPGQTDAYFERARQVQFIGVVCALFSLRHSFSPNFWMNINDPRISFNGIIEQTNLNQNLRDAGLNIIYVPFYLPTTEPRYSFDDQALFTEYTSMLKLLNPAFGPEWIKEFHVFRAPHAQAVCLTDFADLIPPHRTPVRGLYVTDSAQFYPEDRTISAAIQHGRKAAGMVLTEPA